MYKIIGIIAICLIGYFLFINDSAPEYVYFNGEEFGPKKFDRSNDSLSKVYNYHSKTVQNNDYLSILYPEDGTGDLNDWSDLISDHFETKGFKFQNVSGEKMGRKANVEVYLMPRQRENVLFMFLVADTNKTKISDPSSIFSELEKIALDEI